MPLSEHEQRLLDEMEKALSAEDPRLATTLSSPAVARIGGRFSGLFALLSVLGLGLIGAGVSQQLPILGIIGFLCALIGLYFIVNRAITGGNREPKPPRRRGRGSMFDRAQERFDKRRERYDE
jgi:hypothetical protein